MADKNNKSGGLGALYTILLLAGLALLVLGLVDFLRNGQNATVLGMGVLAVIVPAALYPIAQASRRPSNAGADPAQVHLLQSISDRLLISDAAKRITYRQKDRDLLRQAIEDDIRKQDFEAALALVTEMSQAYGYKEEAEQFRERIMEARRTDMDRKLTEGVTALDQIILRHDWDLAMAEADKLMRLYSDLPRSRGLDKRVREAKDRYKHELERQFLLAAERDEVDRAVDLLKELDKYLTEAEAEPLRETARGVIGKKRDNLGVQFKFAVHDKEWSQAVRIGEQIIREFPNTKMADEVRSMLDLLRERAAHAAAALRQTL